MASTANWIGMSATPLRIVANALCRLFFAVSEQNPWHGAHPASNATSPGHCASKSSALTSQMLLSNRTVRG